MLGELRNPGILVFEDFDRDQPDAAGDAVAVEFERGEIGPRHLAGAIHVEAVEQLDEIFLGQSEPLDRSG